MYLLHLREYFASNKRTAYPTEPLRCLLLVREIVGPIMRIINLLQLRILKYFSFIYLPLGDSDPGEYLSLHERVV